MTTSIKLFLVAGGAALLILITGLIYSATPRVTVVEKFESQYLGKEFENPMYWAALVGRKPSNFNEEAAVENLTTKHVIDIGSIIHYRDEDFIGNKRNFSFVDKNNKWVVERVFYVEGNKRGFWIAGRPDYFALIVRNKQNNELYFVRDSYVDIILEGKTSYKQFEDYEKFSNILDAQMNQEKLLISVDIGNYKDGLSGEKLPDEESLRLAEVERLENKIIDILPIELRSLIKSKDSSWPTLIFELSRDEFLKLYSYKFNFGVYTKFIPLFKEKNNE